MLQSTIFQDDLPMTAVTKANDDLQFLKEKS